MSQLIPPQTEDESFIKAATTLLERVLQNDENKRKQLDLYSPDLGDRLDTYEWDQKRLVALDYFSDLCVVAPNGAIAVMMYKDVITVATQSAAAGPTMQNFPASEVSQDVSLLSSTNENIGGGGSSSHVKCGSGQGEDTRGEDTRGEDTRGEDTRGEDTRGEYTRADASGARLDNSATKPPRERANLHVPILNEEENGLTIAAKSIMLIRNNDKKSTHPNNSPLVVLSMANHIDVLRHFLIKRKAVRDHSGPAYVDWTNYCLGMSWSITAARLTRLFESPNNVLFHAAAQEQAVHPLPNRAMQTPDRFEWAGMIPEFKKPVLTALLQKLQGASKTMLEDDKARDDFVKAFRDLICVVLAELHQCFEKLAHCTYDQCFRHVKKANAYQRLLWNLISRHHVMETIFNSLEPYELEQGGGRYEPVEFLRAMQERYAALSDKPTAASSKEQELYSRRPRSENGEATARQAATDFEGESIRPPIPQVQGYRILDSRDRAILDALLLVLKPMTAASVLPKLATWVPAVRMVEAAPSPGASQLDLDAALATALRDQPSGAPSTLSVEALRASLPGRRLETFAGSYHAETLLVAELLKTESPATSAGRVPVYVVSSERSCPVCRWMLAAVAREGPNLRVFAPEAHRHVSACALPEGMNPTITQNVKEKLMAAFSANEEVIDEEEEAWMFSE